MAACSQPLSSRSGHGSVRHSNRLVQSKSPYLQQHANNPVNWWPWCTEAIERAKDENKVIFLSVGYSTCHWCHVMEKESFENAEVAAIMNQYFISIKIDREERPDIDKVYMTFVQSISGSGGWPMSVWLTPNLQPIFGGTYFPPDSRYGQPGFKTLLLAIKTQWESNRSEIESAGVDIISALLKGTKLTPKKGAKALVTDCSEKCFRMLTERFEEEYGGFSLKPKFPEPSNLNFLLRLSVVAKPKSKQSLTMLKHTLKKMADGGIHDHVGKGFHRYSTDGQWHVPHFEKMLYDQAQLAAVYSDAFQITKDENFKLIAEDILEYVSRDLSHPDGGFYSAEDADSLPTHDSEAKKEGAFCVWTMLELKNLLPKPVSGGKDSNLKLHQIFNAYYGVKPNGNVNPAADPHGELKGKNVLIVRMSLDEVADNFGLQVDAVKDALAEACQILFEARRLRPMPHLDSKMITAWNGLMITGFSRAAQVFRNEQYMERAIRSASFIKTHLYQSDSKTLLRSCYRGADGRIEQISPPIQGFCDDYSYLIQGLLDLYEACCDPHWIEWAVELQEKQNELFWDSERFGYFMSSGKDSTVVLRLKDEQDGAEPSSNSVSVLNLTRLSKYVGEETEEGEAIMRNAGKVLDAFGEFLTKHPHAMPQMVCGQMFYNVPCTRLVVAAPTRNDEVKSMLDVIHNHYLPHKILILAIKSESEAHFLYRRQPDLASLESTTGSTGAAAYICQGRQCSLPLQNADDLNKALDKL